MSSALTPPTEDTELTKLTDRLVWLSGEIRGAALCDDMPALNTIAEQINATIALISFRMGIKHADTIKRERGITL